jgi:endonuclease III
MKNSRKYQKKIRKLLSAMENSAAAPPVDPDPFEVMIEAIVAADASAKQTEKGLAGLAAEFVDFNELRVAPVKEVADALGKGHPRAKEKAREIVTILNGIFSRRNTLSLEYAEKMTKRDLRRHLAELGLSPYASACLTMKVFHGHAIPVDETLVECLEMDRRVEPGSSIEDVQSFLERMILQKDGLAAHECFRNYVAKSARALARKRKADAEAKAKAEAEAKAKAEAEAKAKAEAEAAAKARKRRAKAKARRAKRAAGKAAKTRRKAAKPAAKRAATKKTARSRKKAPSRRSAKNRKARK